MDTIQTVTNATTALGRALQRSLARQPAYRQGAASREAVQTRLTTTAANLAGADAEIRAIYEKEPDRQKKITAIEAAWEAHCKTTGQPVHYPEGFNRRVLSQWKILPQLVFLESMKANDRIEMPGDGGRTDVCRLGFANAGPSEIRDTLAPYIARPPAEDGDGPEVTIDDIRAALEKYIDRGVKVSEDTRKVLFGQPGVVNRFFKDIDAGGHTIFKTDDPNAVIDALLTGSPPGKDDIAVPLKDCAFSFRSFQADEHGVNPPTQVSIFLGGEKIKDLVLKSRSGVADKMVTDACLAVNERCGGIQLADGTKVKLPYYQQELITNEDFLLSEFVDGVSGNSLQEVIGLAPGEFDMPNSKAAERGLDADAIRKSATALDLFARSVGLRDLHVDNVIFKPDQLIPIDLEVFSPGHTDSTELFQMPPALVEQDADTRALLQTIKQRMDAVQKRYVPLKTSDFIDYLGQAEAERSAEGKSEIVKTACEKIKEDVQANACQISSGGDAVLLRYVQNCLTGPKPMVPYFVAQNGKIYTGTKVNDADAFAERAA